ncbi:MAG: TIGR03621 family F420-dependent LLM class oxidoreductase [Candidatus Limnocylindria bacterium]
MTRALRFSTQAGSAASGAEWMERARRLEALGYSALLIPDHVIGTQLWSVLPALTAAAVATTKLRVGTLVIANDFRNPLLLARELATLDLISGGRVEIGLGAGWALRDYESLGIPYDRGRVRVERLAESVRLMKRLFTEEKVTHEGRYYRMKEAQLGPAPVQRPHPSIHIAGGGREILTLAGQEADIVGIIAMVGGEGRVREQREVTAEASAQKIAWVRKAAGDRFGEIELSMFLDVTLTDDPEAAVRELAKQFDRPPEQITESAYRVIGSVEDVRKRVLEMRRLGFTYFCLRGPNVEDLGPLVGEMTGT